MTDTPGPQRGATRRKNKPLQGLPRSQRLQLGHLLGIRRGELGYHDRARFQRERGGDDLGWRTFTDIESAYRDTFTAATLSQLARAYEVTYDSMLAVAHGKADRLELAAGNSPRPSGPRPVPLDLSGLPVPEELKGLIEPYAEKVHKLYSAAVARTGVEDPPGAEVFPEDQWSAESWERFRRNFPSPLYRILVISGADAKAELRSRGQRDGTAGLTAALDRAGSAGGAA